jgi:PKHD-type hydroxylase
MRGYCFLHRHFDDDLIDKIFKSTEGEDLTKGMVTGAHGESRESEVRNCQITALNPHKNAWIAGILMYIAKIENLNYGFDISAIRELQITQYEIGGKYDWHHDVIPVYPCQRKLSMIVQLSDGSDYVGGDFEFRDDTTEPIANQLRDKGSILIFPSMMMHRVTPITEGVRKSLVAWIEGPAWR